MLIIDCNSFGENRAAAVFEPIAATSDVSFVSRVSRLTEDGIAMSSALLEVHSGLPSSFWKAVPRRRLRLHPPHRPS